MIRKERINKTILDSKNLPKLRSKSIKIDVKIHIKNYLKKCSKNGEMRESAPPEVNNPPHKDGSALDYPSFPRILHDVVSTSIANMFYRFVACSGVRVCAHDFVSIVLGGLFGNIAFRVDTRVCVRTHARARFRFGCFGGRIWQHSFSC